MNYRSLADLGRDLFELACRLPPDIDLVAGVPRSGFLAAQILALFKNLPVTDVDGLIEGRVIACGPRGENSRRRLETRQRAKVLVIDDSLWSGNQLNRARERLRATEGVSEILYAAAYVAPGSEGLVDYFCSVVRPPRVFEWNVLHHEVMGDACVDLDGVLCRDPTPEENDDGPRYLRFVRTVSPAVIPEHEIGAIVTARLEKYRGETEEWLLSHGITFKRLRMLDVADGRERLARTPHAEFKAQEYLRLRDSGLFIESSAWQARDIFERTGKPVLCWESRKLLGGDDGESRRDSWREPVAAKSVRLTWRLAELARRLVRGLGSLP